MKYKPHTLSVDSKLDKKNRSLISSLSQNPLFPPIKDPLSPEIGPRSKNHKNYTNDMHVSIKIKRPQHSSIHTSKQPESKIHGANAIISKFSIASPTTKDESTSPCHENYNYELQILKEELELMREVVSEKVRFT